MRLIIAGASKSGSEWLLACLREHAAIFMPPASTDFFSRHYDRGLGWYLAHFEEATDAHAVVGEKSTSYLAFPEVPARIHAWDPDVRLLFVLRDPVARAYSHYCMDLRRGEVGEDVRAVLAPGHPLVEEGNYHANIQRFVRLFGEDRVKVVFHEDLVRDDTAFLVEVLRWLGVDDSVRPSLLGRKLHVRRDRPRSVRLFRFASRGFSRVSNLGGRSRRILQLARTSGLVNLFHRLNRGGDFPVFTDDHKRELALYYRPDVELLAQWTGRDLSHWIDPYTAETRPDAGEVTP